MLWQSLPGLLVVAVTGSLVCWSAVPRDRQEDGTVEAASAGTFRLTVLYDNYSTGPDLKTDWGFACLIEGAEETILFDTGTRGEILLENAKKLQVDLEAVEVVVLSHEHLDHTGGLVSVLKASGSVPVYVPQSFTQNASQTYEKAGADVIRTKDPVEICEHVYLTGELDGPVREQALILDTAKGLVVVVGCSHPGIVKILERAKSVLEKDIHLVFGGFHLGGSSAEQISKILADFEKLGVHSCGPTHCTGEGPISKFKEGFGDRYETVGVGKVFEVQAPSDDRASSKAAPDVSRSTQLPGSTESTGSTGSVTD